MNSAALPSARATKTALPPAYDLHAHILPGVDDGPASMDDAVAIARLAARAGTAHILATPHRKDVAELSSIAYIRAVTARLQRRLDDEGIPLALSLGMENHIDETLPADAAAGKALTMNGTRYILVEMPFFGEHSFVEPALAQLQAQGLTPVLAHPERIEAFQRNPELLRRFVERGMLSQITRGSLLGHWGEPALLLALRALREGMAHILSSDTHSPRGKRTPELQRATAIAAEIVGPDRAAAMISAVPKAMLEGKPLPLPLPQPPLSAAAFGRASVV